MFRNKRTYKHKFVLNILMDTLEDSVKNRLDSLVREFVSPSYFGRSGIPSTIVIKSNHDVERHYVIDKMRENFGEKVKIIPGVSLPHDRNSNGSYEIELDYFLGPNSQRDS